MRSGLRKEEAYVLHSLRKEGVDNLMIPFNNGNPTSRVHDNATINLMVPALQYSVNLFKEIGYRLALLIAVDLKNLVTDAVNEAMVKSTW